MGPPAVERLKNAGGVGGGVVLGLPWISDAQDPLGFLPPEAAGSVHPGTYGLESRGHTCQQ